MTTHELSRVPNREQLLYALYEAAELEHNLMCTYLYAAFSLRRGEAEGLSPIEATAVERWRRAILAVAIEEMGHLTACGTSPPPSVGRHALAARIFRSIREHCPLASS